MGLFLKHLEDACHPNPCENNGFCVQNASNYTCNCMEGWNGTNCSEGKAAYFHEIKNDYRHSSFSLFKTSRVLNTKVVSIGSHFHRPEVHPSSVN